MYDVIKNIIGHVWVTGSGAPGDQQYVYYIAGSLIIVLTVVFVDFVRQIFTVNRRRS